MNNMTGANIALLPSATAKVVDHIQYMAYMKYVLSFILFGCVMVISQVFNMYAFQFLV